jgi:hypothetical protein
MCWVISSTSSGKAGKQCRCFKTTEAGEERRVTVLKKGTKWTSVVLVTVLLNQVVVTGIHYFVKLYQIEH